MSVTGEVLFVLAATRSGSTLVDLLLGAHPNVVSLGEVHWLEAYVRQDRRIYDPVHPLICSCGDAVPNCPFWRNVAEALGKPLDSLQLRPKFFSWTPRNRKDIPIRKRLGQYPKRLVRQMPGSYRNSFVQQFFGSRRLARDSMALFKAIFEVTGCQYVVDSSKLPFRYRAIHDQHPEQVRALILARDYRAVVHSKMNRGRSLEEGAISWRQAMAQIEALTADIPEARKCRLKYEALCHDPRVELTRVCDFLGLEFTPAMLRRPELDIHHIGGSPSKFDSSRTSISLDTSYKTAFTSQQLAKLQNMVGNMADNWDY